MLDIVLVSVPFTQLENPPLALAVLKGAIQAEGLTCKTFDVGMELYKHVDNNLTKFNDLQHYFYEEDPISEDNAKIISDFLDLWARNIVDMNPRWVGFSVFSLYSHVGTYLLAERIKKLNPEINIVVGGNGAPIPILELAQKMFKVTSAEKMLNYDMFVKKRKVVDVVISGDGEEPLIELLKNGSVESQKFFYADYNKQEFPFSNFDDFRLADYATFGYEGTVQLPVFSSKGCVRNCDYCDVNKVQGFKYRFRTGDNIVREIVFLAEKYNIRHFNFLDSLANGSVKNLKAMAAALAEYNDANPDKKIRWSASGWISRPAGQMKPELYELLGRSGLSSVSIGVETGSNEVLLAMNKKTVVEGLYWDAEHFEKNGIKFIPLMIVGHWAEKWDNFIETCVLAFNLMKYARIGVLNAINPGRTFEIGEGTPAWDDREGKSELIKKEKSIWWTPKNPSLTYKERYIRWAIFHRLCHEYKLPIMSEGYTKSLSLSVPAKAAEAEEWHDEIFAKYGYNKDIVNVSEYYYEHWDEFLGLVMEKVGAASKPINVELAVNVSHSKGDLPGLRITYNDDIIYNTTLEEGTHTISLPDLIQADTNKLTVSFFNKDVNDTIIDEHGNIIKDKYIIINKFVVDEIDLIDDPAYYYGVLTYLEKGESVQPKAGFWFNDATVIVDFTNPFISDYNKKSNRFTKFDVNTIKLVSPIVEFSESATPAEYRNRVYDSVQVLPY
jgi:radical SAM superfamily enzyme YgiQ (UPF0313 family)